MPCESSAPIKVRLDIPGLEPPWLAYLHRGRNNEIFFTNPETNVSLWTREFVASMPDKVKNIGDIHIAIRSAISKLNLATSEPIHITDSNTSMETDEFCDAHSSSGFFEDSLLDLRDSLYQAVSEDEVSFVCIFDTCALIQDRSKAVLKKCIQNKVACVFPYQLLQELDNLKTRKLGSVDKDARRVIRHIEDCEKMFPDLLVRENPQAPFFNGEVRFEIQSPDDKILKCALLFMLQACTVSGADVADIFFVSNDKNLRQKAISHSMNVLTSEDLLLKLEQCDANSLSSNMKVAFEGCRMHANATKSCPSVPSSTVKPKKKKRKGVSANKHLSNTHCSVSKMDQTPCGSLKQPDSSTRIQDDAGTSCLESTVVAKIYPGGYQSGVAHPVEFNGQRPKTMPKRYSFSENNYYPSESVVQPVRKMNQNEQANKLPNASETSLTGPKNISLSEKEKAEISKKEDSDQCNSGSEPYCNALAGDVGVHATSFTESDHVQENNHEEFFCKYPESQKFVQLWASAVNEAEKRLGDEAIRDIIDKLYCSVESFLHNYETNAFKQLVTQIVALRNQCCLNDQQEMDSNLLLEEIMRQGQAGLVVSSCQQFFYYIPKVAKKFQVHPV